MDTGNSMVNGSTPYDNDSVEERAEEILTEQALEWWRGLDTMCRNEYIVEMYEQYGGDV